MHPREIKRFLLKARGSGREHAQGTGALPENLDTLVFQDRVSLPSSVDQAGHKLRDPSNSASSAGIKGVWGQSPFLTAGRTSLLMERVALLSEDTLISIIA